MQLSIKAELWEQPLMAAAVEQAGGGISFSFSLFSAQQYFRKEQNSQFGMTSINPRLPLCLDSLCARFSQSDFERLASSSGSILFSDPLPAQQRIRLMGAASRRRPELSSPAAQSLWWSCKCRPLMALLSSSIIWGPSDRWHMRTPHIFLSWNWAETNTIFKRTWLRVGWSGTTYTELELCPFTKLLNLVSLKLISYLT